MPSLSQHNYQSGFGNQFATEALQGALPVGQNSPQETPYGLYAEQLTGSSFTAPRHSNRRSWLYRIRPSVLHQPFQPIPNVLFRSSPFDEVVTPPNQLLWSPLPIPEEPTDFLDGIISIGGNGNLSMHIGAGIHVYVANKAMEGRFFYNADGEMLIFPQLGRLHLPTEFGILQVAPGEICVIPRGIKFRVELIDETARGYICENYGAFFRLPELGPIGANGLANPRDFQFPVASYDDQDGDFQLITKFSGNFWSATIDHSPLDVVAWHGNYAPYKYNLANFNAINTVSFDHPDPSIFTVLTSPSETRWIPNIDIVIFPPRWAVAEHTFRPPWFHRNVMSEFMGLVTGGYEAKVEGFFPGGCSLHNCMSGHGPDAVSFEKASNEQLEPRYLANTLAFMFETRFVIQPTKFAVETAELSQDYYKSWQNLKKRFSR